MLLTTVTGSTGKVEQEQICLAVPDHEHQTDFVVGLTLLSLNTISVGKRELGEALKASSRLATTIGCGEDGSHSQV